MIAEVDVSVVVTLHNDGKYLARTLASLTEAAAYAQSRGNGIELVAVLDGIDAATANVLHDSNLSVSDHVQQIHCDHRSVSLSRNLGCAAAVGRYIDISNGDDLISNTSIADMFAAAELIGPGAICVPRFIFRYVAIYHLMEYFGTDQIAAMTAVKYPLVIAKIFGSRQIFVKNEYRDLPLSAGYLCENWHFNCNSIALGYEFLPVNATCLFHHHLYRTRNDHAIRMCTRQIPPASLFRPITFLRRFAAEARDHEQHPAWTAPVTQGLKVLEDPIYRGLIARANAIDPAVELGSYRRNCLGYISSAFDPAIGLAYYRVCEVVGDTEFDAVFMLSGTQLAAIRSLLRVCSVRWLTMDLELTTSRCWSLLRMW